MSAELLDFHKPVFMTNNTQNSINYKQKRRQDFFTYVFGTLRMARCLKKINIRQPLPRTPIMKIKAKINGMM